MNYAILANGDLEITLDGTEDREEIATWCGNEWWSLFDLHGLGLAGNGWDAVAPEWIGALTDAPIVTDGCTWHDDGSHEVYGRVWWFPDYIVQDPIEALVDRGRVVFTAAPPGLEGVRLIVAEKAARSTAYVPRRRKESRAAQALACQGHGRDHGRVRQDHRSRTEGPAMKATAKETITGSHCLNGLQCLKDFGSCICLCDGCGRKEPEKTGTR